MLGLGSIVRGFGPSRPRLIDDLEDIPVDRLAEEKALEWGRPHFFDQFSPALPEALLQFLELRQGIIDRHVPPELTFERRYLEPFDVGDVDLLAASDV